MAIATNNKRKERERRIVECRFFISFIEIFKLDADMNYIKEHENNILKRKIKYF